MILIRNKKNPSCNRTGYKSRLPPLTLRTPAMHLIRAPFNAGITANSTWLLSRFLSTCNSRVIFICILLVSVSHHHRLSWTFLHKLLSPSQFLWFYLFFRIIQLKVLKCQGLLANSCHKSLLQISILHHNYSICHLSNVFIMSNHN